MIRPGVLKSLSVFLSVNILYQVAFPTVAYALTGGPSQPEVESFEPMGTTQMVDPFSGDFNYNIPLMDVDGYPINMAYHSGVTMDQEASWVGLGWNLNPGVISRNMRGLPDDFSGGQDLVERHIYMKPNFSYGITPGVSLELFGKNAKWVEKAGFGLSVSLGVNYDNYRGLGIESGINPTVGIKDKILGKRLKQAVPLDGTGFGLSLNSSSKDGFEMTPKLGIQYSSTNALIRKLGITPNISMDMSINTRSGVKSLSFSGAGINPGRYSSRDIGRVSSQVSFGTLTYTPASPLRMNNSSFALQVKLGIAFKAVAHSPLLRGFFSHQSIAETHQALPGYGYLHNEKADDVNESLMDFNREKDGAFSVKSPVLAIPVNTFDLFSASGQGVGGMYRAFRSDIGMIRERRTADVSDGKSFHIEAGFGVTDYKLGAQRVKNTFKQTQGSWTDNNGLMSRMQHKDKNIATEPLYEPAYFKSVGEKNINEDNLLSDAELGNPVRPSIFREGSWYAVDGNTMVKQQGQSESSFSVTGYKKTRSDRAKRNELMSVRTVGESDFCSQKNIRYYIPGSSTAYHASRKTGTGNTIRPDNHISEVTVTNSQGVRYVYGIPAYNNVEYDYAFTNAYDPDQQSDGSPVKNMATGQVEYDYAEKIFDPLQSNFKDADYKSTGRKHKGNDHLFERNKMPAYAHSYLLTEVQSPDYIPSASGMPGPESSGSSTRIDYYYINTNTDANNRTPYKWRVPVTRGMANYNPGYRSNPSDDGANFMYGEKEMWLVRSIEGRNHIAIFYISKREDALGVADAAGGKSLNQRSYKLDKIELYAKTDMTTPLKTAHFEYDYSLCPGVENNSGTAVDKDGNTTGTNINFGGKLTLKKLYFTYGKSTKGKFNAYKFDYNSENPAYNLKGYDRWGNFKPNPIVTNAAAVGNTEFPYTDQDSKTEADKRASAWSLTDISLPSGGKMNIVYEADDYAYVQDRKAMRMYKIKGFGDAASDENGLVQELYRNRNVADLSDIDRVHNVVFFDLPADWMPSVSAFRNDILSGEQKNLLYFNCYINLTKSSDAVKNYEYVRGYAEVEDVGINTGTRVGWVKLKYDKYHPFAKSAWQLARLYLPQKIYPGTDLRNEPGTANAIRAAIRGLFGYIYDVAERVQGVNDRLKNNDYGRQVDLQRSWIRLNVMNGHKYGGGSRVKRITLSDNWTAMGGTKARTAVYGQEFGYTTKEQYNGAERIISSGVASYEPIIGNDENPFRLPVSYTNDNVGVPDDEFYAEEPFGETFFPGAQVGYSKVTVKGIIPTSGAPSNTPLNNSNHRTGKVVNTFYTARDFPTIVQYTDVDPREHNPSKIFSITRTVNEKYLTASQGFQVELNDMHGKPRSVLNYTQANITSDEEADAFSGVTYEYHTEGPGRLSNMVQVIDANNQVSTRQVGVEVDMTYDARESYSRGESGSVGYNIDQFSVGILPLLTAFIWPEKNVDISGFRSAVISRVVNRYGILKKTIVHDEGAKVSTENLLLDAETGEVLLTRTHNEFKDPIYNTTYPAHWVNAYAGMGAAYKNTGAECFVRQSTAYGFAPYVNAAEQDPATCFVPGDEVIFSTPAGPDVNRTKAWVFRSAASQKWLLLDINGNPLTLSPSVNYTVKVIRSGRRNMQNMPVAQVTALASPVNGSSLLQNTASVINANAIEYSDNWRISNDAYTEASACDYVFGNYEQHKTTMQTEFVNKLIPLIYNKPGVTRTLNSQTDPTATNNITITRSEISAAAATTISQMITDYRACQGIDPTISCTVSQSMSLSGDCGVGAVWLNTTPWLSHNRYLTIELRIGACLFKLDNYRITYTGEYVLNAQQKVCEYGTFTNSCHSSSTLSAGITALDQITFVSKATLPKLNLSGCVTDAVLYYNQTPSNVTYTDGTNTLNYKLVYSTPVNTLFSYNYLGISSPSNISCCKLSDHTPAPYTTIPATIGAFRSSNGGSLSLIQRDLVFFHYFSNDHSDQQKAITFSTPAVSVTRTANPLPCIATAINTIVNPYQKGIAGNWKVQKNWVYYENRTASKNNITDIRNHGTYASYSPFWTGDATGWKKGTALNNWKVKEEITRYSRFGDALESKDALQLHAASLLSETDGMPYAVARNARYTQIANDNMEQYGFGASRDVRNCPSGHFNFWEVPNTSFSITTVAHTGTKGLQIGAWEGGGVVSTFRQLVAETAPGTPDDASGYKLRSGDFNGQFSPSSGIYLVSAWVKVGDDALSNTYANGLNGARIRVVLQQETVNPVIVSDVAGSEKILYPSGPIIDGWQRIEGKIEVSTAVASRISVSLVGANSKLTHYDDLRIHPVDASMKTYVYDPASQRLMAELDENNYATFYEYDAEGKLVRTKRETEKGIVTISETRSGQYRE
jgi:hypothetical protein